MKAQSIIVSGIFDKHLDIIKESTSAKEQIEDLKAVFVRPSSLIKLALWRKLINLKNEEIENLEDLFLRFDTTIRELKDRGSVLAEGDKVCHLLLSLPSKYSHLVTALETVENVKLDFVKHRLLDEELKLNTQFNNIESSFKASSGCYQCGSQQHWFAACPKRERGRGGYNRRSRGGRNYRRGSRGSEQSSRQHINQAHLTEENESEIQLYAANLCSEIDGKIIMVLDSGTSKHFLREDLEKYMINIKNLERPETICKRRDITS